LLGELPAHARSAARDDGRLSCKVFHLNISLGGILAGDEAVTAR
jgi:hypothetical protein